MTAVLTLAVLGGGRLTGAAHAEQQDLPEPLQSLTISAPSRDPVALVLKGVDGRQLSLDAYRGKPFVLHVWATWCGPCKEELPKLNSFLSKHPDAPIVPAAISSGDAAKVSAFLAKAGNTSVPAWTVEQGAFTKWFKSLEIPVTVLIDGKGYVRAFSKGELDWGAPDADAQLTKLLAATHS
ncbi:thiol:disulfide interchange protein I [Neokomagataea thailandica NBRC 106555]|uniref:Thiol:disulfide interchange protein I n=1 Tax=Neokomagataea thailandica NBRC 106555 TaxID=1223520 RepID=A0ABQ0QQJ2_9PROT|nr:thiol:disulfide interchange protein I [Neokomagataea thailandica NBRC 106555]